MKVITFGCRLNAFESRLIEKIGTDLADVIVVNTCAVTGEAERQCRQSIRKIHRENPTAKIIVTGCAAQLNPEIYAAMPEVFRVLGNREKLTRAAFETAEKVCVSDADLFDFEELQPVTDFEGRTRAFLQIQQGCNHACTFCIVHQARGHNKGLPPEKVLEQARLFVENGFSEIVLTGVDIASYPQGFHRLVRLIAEKVTGLKRLRFGSLDPTVLDEEFIGLMGTYSVIQPHLHLSVQSGDDLILKRMGRRHTAAQVVKACQALRAVRPDMVFGADFITGFPTETEAQALKTEAFVREANITQLHVFPYSARPGTPAAKMPPVEPAVRKERAARLRQAGFELEQKLLDQTVGTVRPVLIEKNGSGYTDNYLKVHTDSKSEGKIEQVLIKQRIDNELVGEVKIRA